MSKEERMGPDGLDPVEADFGVFLSSNGRRAGGSLLFRISDVNVSFMFPCWF